MRTLTVLLAFSFFLGSYRFVFADSESSEYDSFDSEDMREWERDVLANGDCSLLPPGWSRPSNAITVACAEGIQSIVRFCLKKRADPEATDQDGYTPLHLAVHSLSYEIVEMLVEHGVNIDVQNRFNGMTPLHLASTHQDPAFAVYLLQKGAKINAHAGMLGDTPLSMALRLDRAAVVEALLKQGANPNLPVSCNGETALFVAIRKKNHAMVNLLLKYTANVEQVSHSLGSSPVYVAIQKNSIPILATLLQHKADPNVRNNLLETPLHKAIELNHIEAVQLLLTHGAKTNRTSLAGQESPLHTAIRIENIAIIELLLQESAPINQQQKDGRTALAVAVSQWKPKPRQISNYPNVALSGTGSTNDSSVRILEIVELLLRYGADPNISDNDGDTPLHLCMRTLGLKTRNGVSLSNLDTSIVRMLLQHNASTENRNRAGQLPGDIARTLGLSLEYVEDLLLPERFRITKGAHNKLRQN